MSNYLSYIIARYEKHINKHREQIQNNQKIFKKYYNNILNKNKNFYNNVNLVFSKAENFSLESYHKKVIYAHNNTDVIFEEKIDNIFYDQNNFHNIKTWKNNITKNDFTINHLNKDNEDQYFSYLIQSLSKRETETLKLKYQNLNEVYLNLKNEYLNGCQDFERIKNDYEVILLFI